MTEVVVEQPLALPGSAKYFCTNKALKDDLFHQRQKKIIKVEEQFLSLNYASVKKPKTPTKTKMLDKKHDVLDFWNALSFIFLYYTIKNQKNKKNQGEFGFFFFDKGTPYFDCIKADDLRLD